LNPGTPFRRCIATSQPFKVLSVQTLHCNVSKRFPFFPPNYPKPLSLRPLKQKAFEMKRILVVYYTQTGQLHQIIDSVLSPLVKDEAIAIDYEQLKPVEDYPFPWGKAFFDCFPESVMDIPCDLEAFSFDPETRYDLVILAYQTWFLSPSIPFASFLQTEKARKLLKDTRVITLLGIRNMWIGAQEIVKKKLAAMGAKLVGNIVLDDHHNNWVAGVTIVRWLVSGKRGPSGIWPRAGVSEKDIREASRFGHTILEAVKKDDYSLLQEKLVAQKAVKIKYNLYLIEKNARKIFVKFARSILKNGKKSPALRERGIRFFKMYLLFALFVLAPVVSLIFILLRFLFFPFANRRINYFKGVLLKP